MQSLSLFLLALGGVSALPATANNELAPRAIVAGKTFDRFVQIFLENQDYSRAVANCELKSLPTFRFLLKWLNIAQ